MFVSYIQKQIKGQNRKPLILMVLCAFGFLNNIISRKYSQIGTKLKLWQN
jgi:hypothetical protein